jgi:hypothetical protein
MTSKTSDQEEPTTTRGDSEILSIEHSPESQIPAFGKAPEYELKVFATVDSEQPRNVLNDQPLREKLRDDAHSFVEEAAAVAREPFGASVPGGSHDADILAGESHGDAAHGPEIFCSAGPNVGKLSGVRKSVSKASPVGRVDLDLPGCFPSSSLESFRESVDAGEEASVGKFIGH